MSANQRLLFAVEDSEKDLREKLAAERHRSLTMEKVMQQQRNSLQQQQQQQQHVQQQVQQQQVPTAAPRSTDQTRCVRVLQ